MQKRKKGKNKRKVIKIVIQKTKPSRANKMSIILYKIKFKFVCLFIKERWKLEWKEKMLEYLIG